LGVPKLAWISGPETQAEARSIDDPWTLGTPEFGENVQFAFAAGASDAVHMRFVPFPTAVGTAFPSLP
jgi:hypothetical protein